jgi:hypothetical protein
MTKLNLAAVLLACLCSWSCGGPRVITAYPGPTRPDAELTTLHVQVNTGVMVDDNNQTQCSPLEPDQECRFSLLPGPHKLRVWYADSNTRSKDARAFKLDMPAGHSYLISAAPVVTLDDWAVFVFNTSNEDWRLIYSDRDQHCKACPPIK